MNIKEHSRKILNKEIFKSSFKEVVMYIWKHFIEKNLIVPEREEREGKG